MITRLLFLVQGATPSQREARVATASDPLEPGQANRIAALPPRIGRVDRAWSSPSRAAQETVRMLAAAASVTGTLRTDSTPEPALADLDLGRWTGRSLQSIAVAEPEAMSRWLEDGSAPPGGETLDALLDRVRLWMQGVGQSGGRHLAIAPAMVARAAIAVCFGNQSRFIRCVDPDPLCLIRFDGRDGRWTLRSIVPHQAAPDATA